MEEEGRGWRRKRLREKKGEERERLWGRKRGREKKRSIYRRGRKRR